MSSGYDTAIFNYFDEGNNSVFRCAEDELKPLRYGENPHQRAAFYTQVRETEGTLTGARQLQGKELSYNNIGDTDGALEALKEFDEPTIVAAKHANPCGVGSSSTLSEAFKKAYEADPVSIYGGIVAANREVDKATAELMAPIFLEVVVAPSFSEEALEVLRKKKNLRLLELPHIGKRDYKAPKAKTVLGGLLIQDMDLKLLDGEPKVVTERKPTEKEMEDLLFAWKVVKHTKSNAIVLAKDKCTTGVGPGQVSRIWALENAARVAADLEASHPDDPRPSAAVSVCTSWSMGDVLMPAAKRAILDVHAMARDMEDPVDAALCHAVGQGCSCVHTPKHALGLPVYELTTAYIRGDGDPERVVSTVRAYEASLDRAGRLRSSPRRWAPFLIGRRWNGFIPKRITIS